MKSIFFSARQSVGQAFHFQKPADWRCVCACVCCLTSAAEIVLIDLDHEFSINITKHAAVHPVRHKPK